MTDERSYMDQTVGFLRASEERRLADAEAYLAEDVIFVFPGAELRKLADVHASAAKLYASIRKTFLTWDVVAKDDGSTVVVSTGTLGGTNVHGAEFQGIRYIDRITWRGDRIVIHEVWNDLAISGVLDPPAD